MGLLAGLALRDYRHDAVTSLCNILALGAVLVPLLVLFGLKHGIISNLLQPLVEDPRFREVLPVASGRFDASWFERMQSRDDVAFVVPKTRAIAATMEIRLADTAIGRLIDVELIPTGARDPALPATSIPALASEVVLSQGAADALGAEAGTRMSGIVRRVRGGSRETETISLVVRDIAPASAFARRGAFVPISLLIAVEDYRDAREDEIDPTDEHDVGAREFAGFRLYASRLQDVAELRKLLTAQAVEVRTHDADIELVTRLDRNLAIVFWLIAAIAAAGYGLSFGSGVWASVERKIRDFSVLRLIGFRTRAIVLFPMVQALATSVIGWSTAVIIVLAAQAGINVLFADHAAGGNEAICRLQAWHLLVAAMMTIGVAMVAALLGGSRVARRETAPQLRDV